MKDGAVMNGWNGTMTKVFAHASIEAHSNVGYKQARLVASLRMEAEYFLLGV